MVLSDIVAGIQLVKQSVDFIKSSINTVSDVNGIVDAVENLLDGEQQLNAERSKKDGIRLRDQFGIKSVAHEIIDAKLAAEERYNMSVLIDQRFGHGTFKSIVDLRAQRMQEAKEHAKQVAKEKKQKQDEMIEIIAIGIGVVLLGGLLVAIAGALMVDAMERGSPSFSEWLHGS